MGKYSQLQRQTPPPPRPWTIHPVWRGIGCLMALILPVVTIAAASMVVDYDLEAGWYPVPGNMMNPFTIPVVNYTLPHLYATLVVSVVLLLFIFAAIMIIYAIVYAVLGPKRYGPHDSPPIRETRVRKKPYVKRKR